MSSPDATLELQAAVRKHLLADAGVAALVADRIYDNVPKDAAKPYLSFGPVQILSSIASEYEGSDETFQLDGWSAGPKSAEAKKIGAAVRLALAGAALDLGAKQRLVLIEHEQTDYLVEPDGVGHHAAMTFKASTEPAN